MILSLEDEEEADLQDVTQNVITVEDDTWRDPGILLYLITRLNILFYNEEGGVSFVTKHVLERDTKRPATDSCCLTSSFRGR